MHRYLWLGMLGGVVVFGTGCPEVYGKQGSLDDAMGEDIKAEHRRRQDEKESVAPCPDGRAPQKRCEPSDPSSPCRWICR